MKKNITDTSIINNINNKHILKDSVFKVGKVTSVEGRFIKVTVDKSKNPSHLLYKGGLLKNISVGSGVAPIFGYLG